ncbi:MAG: hypothetical protein K2O08_00560 [Clostridia bacterium]|nr:hypothetical protein [Clostridia bacterium]
MKKNAKIIIIAVLLVALCLLAVACKDGKSAYDIAVENGFSGSYQEWLDSLKGETGDVGSEGDKGETGNPGDDGDDGLSAYQIYCKYHPKYKGSEEEWINAYCDGSLQNSYNTNYNMIFTKATIPPVLSALYSIGNGYDTYALIERGITYRGIADSDAGFNNVGFDSSKNGTSFSRDDYANMLNKINELNVFGNEKFIIYLRDADLYYGYLFVRDAGLTDKQYEIVICEDGAALYNGFRKTFINGKTASENDDQPYDTFVEQAIWAKEYRETVLNSADLNMYDLDCEWDFVIPATTLDNVKLYMQDKAQLISMVESICADGYTSKVIDLLNGDKIDGYELNVHSANISYLVNSLDEKSKQNYIELMYGDYYEDTYKTLTRTKLSDNVTTVPQKKLVFIGSRFNAYPKWASSDAYGIGGAKTVADVPDSYAQLDQKYKHPLLFATQADYDSFISTFNNADSWATAPTQTQKDAIKVAAFNDYLNYMFAFKYVYAMNGKEFDIIIKGHPAESIGGYEGWNYKYPLEGYYYGKLVNALLVNFHSKDSVGKFISMIPYGTSAENLAYLGLGDNLSIGGLSSSTYNGYDRNVDVRFILASIDTDIMTASLNLSGRYSDGSLVYHENGEEKITELTNNGNLFKNLYNYYTAQSNTAYANMYKNLYENWLRKQCNLADDASLDGYGVDGQGFIIRP